MVTKQAMEQGLYSAARGGVVQIVLTIAASVMCVSGATGRAIAGHPTNNAAKVIATDSSFVNDVDNDLDNLDDQSDAKTSQQPVKLTDVADRQRGKTNVLSIGNDSDPNSDPETTTNTEVRESSCPIEITSLAPELLEDFASYYNRTLIRSRLVGESATSTRMLLTSDPEILDDDDLAEFGSEAIEGFFFTTLERTYRNGQPVQQQGFHQVFLTRDVVGWLVVTTRSGWGDYPASVRMTPPRDSSSGLVAQTVRTWLRDCEAR